MLLRNLVGATRPILGVIILIAAAYLEPETGLFLSCVTGRVTGARASGTSGVFAPL